MKCLSVSSGGDSVISNVSGLISLISAPPRLQGCGPYPGMDKSVGSEVRLTCVGILAFPNDVLLHKF